MAEGEQEFWDFVFADCYTRTGDVDKSAREATDAINARRAVNREAFGIK